MASVTLTAQLVDKVSGPANSATKSLDKMNRAAGNFDRRGTFGKSRRQIDGINNSSRLASSAMATASMQGNLMAMAIGKAADFAKQAAMAILRMGAAFAMSIAKAAAFGEGLQFSLSKFLGSSDQARKEIAGVLSLSNQLGLGFQQTASNFKDLISAGFAPKAAKEMIRFKADLLAMGTGGPEASMKIESAFGHIQKAMAQGRMEADAFTEILGNLPITKMQIMEKLAVKMGKSTSDLMKMEITKLPIKELLESMQEAMLSSVKAGKLGETALKKQKQTVGGMLSLIKNRIFNIPDMIAMRLEGSGLKTILEDILKGLDSAEAKAAIDAIVSIINSLGKSLKAAWPTIKATGQALIAMGAAVFAAGEQMGKLLGIDMGPAEQIAFVIKTIAVATGVLVAALAAGLALALAPFVALYQGAMIAAEGIKQFGSFVMSSIENLVGYLGYVKSRFSLLGSDMIGGLVQGIKNAGGAVVSAITGVVGDSISSAKRLLGISSPSRVFAEMGKMSGLGYSQGFEKAMANPPGFESIAASIPAMSAAAVAPSFGRGGNNVTQTNNNTFNVTEAQSAEETARMVKRMQLLEMANAFEQMAIEVGG